MKTLLLCVLALAAFASAQTPPATSPTKLKVLVITGGHGFMPGPFFKIFQDNPGIDYTSAIQHKSAEAYERDDLLTYDVIVLYDAPQTITDGQKTRFLSLFDKGVGVIVLHHALLSYQSWPEYERIAGAKYLLDFDRAKDPVTPPSTYQGNADINVKVADAKHPVTQGISDFYLHDEIYRGVRMSADITPLLLAEDKPLVWARDEKKSRIISIIIGHGPASYTNANFMKLLNQSILWTARRS